MSKEIPQLKLGDSMENSPITYNYKDYVVVLELDSSNSDIQKLDLLKEPFKLDFFLMTFCKSGRMSIKVNFSDITLEKNQILIIFPNTIIEFTGFRDDYSMSILCISPQIKEIMDFTQQILPIEYLLKYFTLTASQDDFCNLITIFDILAKRLQSNDYKPKEAVINACVKLLTADITHLAGKIENRITANESSRQQSIFDKFVQLVISDCAVHRDIRHYSQKLCLTPKYLAQVILSVSGRYAKDIICDHVIIEAKALLRKGLTSQQVSAQLNFPNPSYFGVFFLKHTGTTPRNYYKGR